MKQVITFIIFVLILLVVLLLATSHSNAQAYKETRVLNVKVIPIRLIEGDTQQVVCKPMEVTINRTTNNLTIYGDNILLFLKGLYRYSADRDAWEAVDTDNHKYTIYYYKYRDRIYIQVSPIHNGQVDFINKSEIIYIITTDNICQ
jgi:hypothetical protein